MRNFLKDFLLQIFLIDVRLSNNFEINFQWMNNELAETREKFWIKNDKIMKNSNSFEIISLD